MNQLIHNLKLHRQVIFKLGLGAALLLLSAFITVLTRDALSMQHPENSLPVMDVYYNGLEAGDRLPAAHIRRDKYQWRFLFWKPVSGGGLDLQVWRSFKPGTVNPATKMDLQFTFPPKEVEIYVAAGESDFVKVPGELVSPKNPGTYFYKVEASWGQHRTVTYYFNVRIPVWN